MCAPSSQYYPGLADVIASRHLQHLSKSYRTMKLSTFLATIAPLGLSADDVEKLLLVSSNHHSPAVRVNHATNYLQFLTDSPEARACGSEGRVCVCVFP